MHFTYSRLGFFHKLFVSLCKILKNAAKLLKIFDIHKFINFNFIVMSVRIRINREFTGTLVDYCGGAGGFEWICVFRHPSWYIYARESVSYRKRNPWKLIRQCGSFANYVRNWQFYVGVYKSYASRSYERLAKSIFPVFEDCYEKKKNEN